MLDRWPLSWVAKHHPRDQVFHLGAHLALPEVASAVIDELVILLFSRGSGKVWRRLKQFGCFADVTEELVRDLPETPNVCRQSVGLASPDFRCLLTRDVFQWQLMLGGSLASFQLEADCMFKAVHLQADLVMLPDAHGNLFHVKVTVGDAHLVQFRQCLCNGLDENRGILFVEVTIFLLLALDEIFLHGLLGPLRDDVSELVVLEVVHESQGIITAARCKLKRLDLRCQLLLVLRGSALWGELKHELLPGHAVLHVQRLDMRLVLVDEVIEVGVRWKVLLDTVREALRVEDEPNAVEHLLVGHEVQLALQFAADLV